MGDDAEYYMEQMEEEARFKQACEYAARDRNRKSLLCWTDGYPDEIWCWEPLTRVSGVFSNLHIKCQIGKDFFLSNGIPLEDDEEDWSDEYENPTEPNDSSEIKLIDELEFHIANSEDDATHEVIVLSQHDAPLLKNEAIRQKGFAKTLREEMLVEMLEEMALFIEQNIQRDVFIFARTL